MSQREPRMEATPEALDGLRHIVKLLESADAHFEEVKAGLPAYCVDAGVFARCELRVLQRRVGNRLKVLGTTAGRAPEGGA